jgi:hypothetical protein
MKLQQGENRIRIVQAPIAGWIDWDNKTPLRFDPDNKPRSPINPSKPIKGFWALYVWDYAQGDLFILELTQATLITGLEQLGEDSDFGDFSNYDIKIFKEGSDKLTKYKIMGCPPRPMNPEIAQALKSKPARLEALYCGQDPWTDLIPSVSALTQGIASNEEFKPFPKKRPEGDKYYIEFIEEKAKAVGMDPITYEMRFLQNGEKGEAHYTNWLRDKYPGVIDEELDFVVNN